MAMDDFDKDQLECVIITLAKITFYITIITLVLKFEITRIITNVIIIIGIIYALLWAINRRRRK